MTAFYEGQSVEVRCVEPEQGQLKRKSVWRRATIIRPHWTLREALVEFSGTARAPVQLKDIRQLQL